jgi:hypothetical protein
MYNVPFIHSPFEAILDDLGTDRSRLGAIRTAAHAACARHRSRGVFASRRDDAALLAAILGAAEDPFPALRYHR